MIFADVLKSFVDDSKTPNSRDGRLKAAFHLLGSLRRMIKPNRVEPSPATETLSKPDPECPLPRIGHMFSAERQPLHCLINVENEATDFSLALGRHLANRGSGRDTVAADLEKYGKPAWQSSSECVQRGRPLTNRPGETGLPARGAVSGDMEVVDLASASSSEEALVVANRTWSPIRI